MKKHIATIVQLGIGVAILAVIFTRLQRDGKLSELRDSFAGCASNLHFLIPALLSFVVCLLMCTLRWQLLLRQQGLNLSFHRVHALYYLGHFFNAFLLGATGGDVAKAYYVTLETRHKKTEAVATVLIDRLIGLLSLIGLCAVTTFLFRDFFLQHQETRHALKFTVLLVAAGCALLAGALFKPWLDQWSIFSRLMNATPVGRMLERMYTALHGCIRSPRVALLAVVYSLVNHVAIVAGTYLLGRAMEWKLTFANYLMVFPLINMISALPITPSGIGTRDAAAIYLLSAFNVEEAHAVSMSLMLYGIVMFWSLVGGVVYAVYASRAGKIRETSDAG